MNATKSARTTLFARMERIRQKRRISKKQVAEEAGVHRITLYTVLNGSMSDSAPSTEKVKRWVVKWEGT